MRTIDGRDIRSFPDLDPRLEASPEQVERGRKWRFFALGLRVPQVGEARIKGYGIPVGSGKSTSITPDESSRLNSLCEPSSVEELQKRHGHVTPDAGRIAKASDREKALGMLPSHRVRYPHQFGNRLRQRVVALRDTQEPAEAAASVEEVAKTIRLAVEVFGKDGEVGLVPARLFQDDANGIVDEPISVTLLLAEIDDLVVAEALASRRKAAGSRVRDGRAVRLLLVEDGAMSREIAQMVLEAMGYHVAVACDGQEAVGIVAAGDFDLVLMDVEMPVMDGITATRRIRALAGPARNVPIVAMTAHILPEMIERLREAGVDAHVGKPFDRHRFQAEIERCLAAAARIASSVAA